MFKCDLSEWHLAKWSLVSQNLIVALQPHILISEFCWFSPRSDESYILVNLCNSFQLTAEDLDCLLTECTRATVVCAPVQRFVSYICVEKTPSSVSQCLNLRKLGTRDVYPVLSFLVDPCDLYNHNQRIILQRWPWKHTKYIMTFSHIECAILHTAFSHALSCM